MVVLGLIWCFIIGVLKVIKVLLIIPMIIFFTFTLMTGIIPL